MKEDNRNTQYLYLCVGKVDGAETSPNGGSVGVVAAKAAHTGNAAWVDGSHVCCEENI